MLYSDYQRFFTQSLWSIQMLFFFFPHDAIAGNDCGRGKKQQKSGPSLRWCSRSTLSTQVHLLQLEQRLKVK